MVCASAVKSIGDELINHPARDRNRKAAVDSGCSFFFLELSTTVSPNSLLTGPARPAGGNRPFIIPLLSDSPIKLGMGADVRQSIVEASYYLCVLCRRQSSSDSYSFLAGAVHVQPCPTS
jgi:hypothetical protein